MKRNEEFTMSAEMLESYNTWQEELSQDSYEELKTEWIAEHGVDNLDEFEQTFATMFYEDEPD
jgi:hypothetical protein